MKKKLLLSLLILLIVSSCLGTYAFRHLGEWLCESDPLPQSLDILFSFAGDLDRYDYSKEIFFKYPNTFWLVSTGVVPVFDTLTLGTIVKKNLAIEHFDTNRILVNDTCTTTFGELLFLKSVIKKLQESGPAKTINVGLLSSPYHIGRILTEVKRNIGTNNIVYYRIAVPLDKCIRTPAHPKEWWKYEGDAKFVFSEVIKVAYYRIKYR